MPVGTAPEMNSGPRDPTFLPAWFSSSVPQIWEIFLLKDLYKNKTWRANSGESGVPPLSPHPRVRHRPSRPRLRPSRRASRAINGRSRTITEASQRSQSHRHRTVTNQVECNTRLTLFDVGTGRHYHALPLFRELATYEAQRTLAARKPRDCRRLLSVCHSEHDSRP